MSRPEDVGSILPGSVLQAGVRECPTLTPAGFICPEAACAPRVRSILKYPGGKYALLDAIAANLPISCVDTYVEPFVGGASVALNIGVRFSRMVLNDANLHLVNFWEMVKEEPQELLARLVTLSAQTDKESYTKIRERFNKETLGECDTAAYFYYLNRQGFNGLIRYNSKGEFNVPYGRHKSFYLPGSEHLLAVSDRLRGAELSCQEWKPFIWKALGAANAKRERSFVYLDPPYLPVSKTASFTGYWRAFSVSEHEELRDTLDDLSRAGVKWMLSNSKCGEAERIFAGYDFTEVRASRSISCKGATRGAVSEYLIKNY